MLARGNRDRSADPCRGNRAAAYGSASMVAIVFIIVIIAIIIIIIIIVAIVIVIIKCASCSRRFFFDFIWELCYRMLLHAGWYKRYLDSPARRDILERVEPALRELLDKTRIGNELVLAWSRCFTCEFENAVRTRAAVELRDLRAVVRKLEPLPGRAAVMAVEYGVIDAPRMLLPLSRGPNADAPCENAAFNGLRLVVTVWPSALKAELVGDEGR